MNEEKKGKREILLLILIVIFIAALIFSITIFIKNKNLIIEDPLIYGMDKHKFDSCTCFDEEGTLWYTATYKDKKVFMSGSFLNNNNTIITDWEVE